MNTKLLAKLLSKTKGSGELHQNHIAMLIKLLSEPNQNKLLKHFNNNLVMFELSVSFPYKSLDKLSALNKTSFNELSKTIAPAIVDIVVSSTLAHVEPLKITEGVSTTELLTHLNTLPDAYINYRSTPNYTYIDITGVIINLVQSNNLN